MTAPRWLPWALLALCVAANGLLGVDVSYAKGEAKRLAGVVDSLERVKSRVDTVHAVTVRNVVRQVTRLDTLTRDVERWKHDTIRVVEFVTQADSLARACTAVIRSCEAKVANRDAIIAATQAKARADLAVLQAKVPSLRSKLTGAALTFGAGYLVARLTP